VDHYTLLDENLEEINSCLSHKTLHPLEKAKKALTTYPTDARLLSLACFAALVEEQPGMCLNFVKRYKNHYYPDERIYLCEGMGLALLGKWFHARQLFEKYEIGLNDASYILPPGINRKWGYKLTKDILRWKPQQKNSRKKIADLKAKQIKRKVGDLAGNIKKASKPVLNDDLLSALIKPLTRYPAKIPITFSMLKSSDLVSAENNDSENIENYQLRAEYTNLMSIKEIDNLLCLPELSDVDCYFYQIETARKVIKQFRGRVLLADEVGLGKTIEAGMILKEYMLRGMAERILILTPASLVGQWHEEMEKKFNVDFITTYDSECRRNPAEFWQHPRIIASIASARLSRNFEHVIKQDVDLVIVDEAHHLKNCNTKNWKLVDALKKRFLLLLSATPVQNNLVELFNLLTLLKPGIFKTEKEFRSVYMVKGKPRIPANREKLQNLMRDVMIRNTRALVDVKLPPRHAATLKVTSLQEERDCYLEMDRLIRKCYLENGDKKRNRLSLHHLLAAAGSTPKAISASIHNFLNRNPSIEWKNLYNRYSKLHSSAKVQALLNLINKNLSEKQMIFIRYSESVNHLFNVLKEENIRCVRFDGQMSGPDKDAAIEYFRDDANILLCTEAGGEGRNVQFCNTIVNFDLPWNPQAIEQRIGRIHRIGQEREVFIFNMVTEGTIEEQILRILDEKINMFELVVGEMQSILGEMDENKNVADMFFNAWIETTDGDRVKSFDDVSDKILTAKQQYEGAKELDDHLFAEEYEVV